MSNRNHYIKRFLFLSFEIAWASEFLLIFLYRLNILNSSVIQVFHFLIIGFGAGMAPAYAAFIVEKKYSQTNIKVFIRRIFYTKNYRLTLITLLLFAFIQFCACVIQEDYLGNPWYYFILYMPLMILGGGLEEVGWNGVFQPFLEKRFQHLLSALIGGVIWSVWHLPLWLIPNTAQSGYNFVAFTLYCIVLRITLDTTYRITKSVWISILLHAWGNTVLGGMYTLTSLCCFPGIKTLLIYGIQLVLIIAYEFIVAEHGIYSKNKD